MLVKYTKIESMPRIPKEDSIVENNGIPPYAGYRWNHLAHQTVHYLPQGDKPEAESLEIHSLKYNISRESCIGEDAMKPEF